MNKIDKELLRAAVAIHDHAHRNERCRGNGYAESQLGEIQRLRRQIKMAHERGWHAAAHTLVTDLADACWSLHRQLDTAFRELPPRGLPRRRPTVSAVYHDLRALKCEFGEVQIDLKAHELSITTDPIELEGVVLGPFQIVLDLAQVGQASQPYRVVALEPHPPVRARRYLIPTFRISSFVKVTAERPSPLR